MSNLTNAFQEKPTRKAWMAEPQLDGKTLASYALPASSIVFQDGQALGRDASGNIVQMDDTLKAEFVGFETDVVAGSTTVLSTDTLGDKIAHVHRPYAYIALVAAAAAGQEGKKVWWLYNNQVQLTPGTNANFAGTVLGVIDATHVLVLSPWLRGVTQSGSGGIVTTAAAVAVTLTKFDINKIIAMPLTSSEAITLPAASSVSPGDDFTFLNTSSNSSVPTITAAGSDTINGSASLAMSSVQYATLTVRSDGVSKWYSAAQNVSGTLGATTFSGNIGITGTITGTSTSANSLAVGPAGATNPVLNVDSSTSSQADGIDIVGLAAGSGVNLTVITSGTNSPLNLAGAGSGNIVMNATGTGITLFTTGITIADAKNIVLNTTTGTKIGTGTTQKLAFWNSAPIVQPANTVDYVTMLTNLGLRATGGTASATFPGAITCTSLLSSGATGGGVGYATGAGGAVTQITSRTTGVTLNTLTGAITLVSAAGSATAFVMTVTNSTVAATDTVVASQKSGTDSYSAVVSAVTAGTFKLTITDLTGTTTEQPVINFTVLKGAAS